MGLPRILWEFCEKYAVFSAFQGKAFIVLAMEAKKGNTTESSPGTSDWVRTAELTQMLGCSSSSVYTLAKTFDFPTAYRLSTRGDLQWLREDIEAWLKTRKVQKVLISDTAVLSDRRKGPRKAVTA